MAEHFDVIIIGTGAGGGTLAHALAGSGKRILLLERGDFLPRETEQLGPAAGVRRRPVHHQGHLVRQRWQAVPAPGALLRRRRDQDVRRGAVPAAARDFGELRHVDGISPAWPLSYDDFEPWYSKAEQLYQVHGNGGEDPTEGHRSAALPVARRVTTSPGSHEIAAGLEKGGYHPFHAPCGILLDEADRPAASASGAPGATGTRAWCTPSPTPRSSRSGRCSAAATSPC